MENKATNPLHLANMKKWNASSKRWGECADSRGIWQQCHKNPTLVFSEKLLQRFQDIANKKVCVLGSGDNEAVFAMAGLGAKVTSVDISQKQLDIASERAEMLGLEITFQQGDVTDLTKLKDNHFDIVFTGGHVAVWVSDLKKYYAEAARILSIGGLFIVEEYHPFRRVWKESKTELVVENDYYNRGPYRYFQNSDILYSEAGTLESFEFHWTISDFFQAILQAGCAIVEVDEYGTYVGDWENAPMAGLPENLLIVAKKVGDAA